MRRRVDVPIAADESIRRADDPYRVRDLEAADVAVLKVQPLGGVRACLRIAEDIGLPVVVSSALETSVGIAAGVALAAALPELPYACGLATVQLLTADVVARRRCCRSTAPCRSAAPTSTATGSAARRPPTPDRAAHWRAGCAGRIRSRAAVDARANASTALATTAVDELVRGGVADVVLAPGVAHRAARLRGPRTAPAVRSPCTPGSTSGRPASWRSGSPAPRDARSPS